MNSHTTDRFRKAFAELPADARKQARQAYHLFVEDIIWYWIGSHAGYDNLLKEFKK